MGKKKLFMDLDDTYKDTETYLRCILKNYGIKIPETMSVYALYDIPQYRGYIEEVFGDYENIPNMIGARENFKLLQTEYKIIFCSSCNSEQEAIGKKKFAESLNKEIILCSGKQWDKSHVDMSGGVFIDDNKDILNKSNASVKIQMFNPYSYSGIANGSYLATNWYTVSDLLMEVNVNEKLRGSFCQGIQEFHSTV